MTRRRWIADEVQGDRAALIGEHAQHLSRVLRVRPGQQFDVAAGDTVRLGTVVHVADDRVDFELGEVIPTPSIPQITLLLSVFKFDRMEWAIEKCTELGVATIVPVIASRTETHLAQAAGKRVERWRRLVLAAAEQSRRVESPELSDPIELHAGIGQLSSNKKVVLSENELTATLRDLFSGQEPLSAALAIGPEGGWTSAELKLFHDSGWESATLGPTILRAETAAIAAVTIALAEML